MTTLIEDELKLISEIGLVEWHKQTEGEGRPLYSELLEYLDYRFSKNPSNLMVLEVIRLREELRKAEETAKYEREQANEWLTQVHDLKNKEISLAVELQFIKDKTAPMLEECKKWANVLEKWSPFYGTRMREMKRAIALYETGDFIKYHDNEEE